MGNGNESFASVLQTFLGSSSHSLLKFVCALGMSATFPRAAVTCDYHVTVSPRTHEQLRVNRTLYCALTPWSTVSHMAGGTSCTFVMVAQSASRCVVPFEDFCTAGVNRQAVRMEPRCDPPTHLLFGTSTHIKVCGVLAKAS